MGNNINLRTIKSLELHNIDYDTVFTKIYCYTKNCGFWIKLDITASASKTEKAGHVISIYYEAFKLL